MAQGNNSDCWENCRPEFNPQDPHCGRKETVIFSIGCLLTDYTEATTHKAPPNPDQTHDSPQNK